MQKINFLRQIDRFLGPVLIAFISHLVPSRKQRTKHIKKLLVIRPGGIGDAVLLVPIIAELKKTYPELLIDVLAENRNYSVFSMSWAVKRVFQYDKPSELLSVLQGSYDIVIDTEQWYRLSAVVARLTRAPISIGYATNMRKYIFSHPEIYSQNDYEMDCFFKLLSGLGKDAKHFPGSKFLDIPFTSRRRAASLLSPLASRRIVGIFPGGSVEEKKWGSNSYHQLAVLLHEKGYALVVVGGKEEASQGAKILHNLSNSINLSATLSLTETAAVLNELSLLVTGDSGVMHIGYGLGINIVALFGPGSERKWAPRGRNCIVINKNLFCSPCTTFGYTPKCNRGAECIKKISVEEVFTAALTLLEK